MIVKVIGKDGRQRDVIQCVLILWGDRVEFLIVKVIGKDGRQRDVIQCVLILWGDRVEFSWKGRSDPRVDRGCQIAAARSVQSGRCE